MKYYNVHWSAIVEKVGAWSEISPGSRAAFLELKRNESVPAKSFHEADLQRMTAGGLARLSPNGARVVLQPGAFDFSKVMRAMKRSPLGRSLDDREAMSYVTENFTTAEQRAMLWRQPINNYYFNLYAGNFHRFSNPKWLQEFLDLADAKAALQWEKPRVVKPVDSQFEDGSPYFADEQLFQATHALIEAAMHWAEPAPLLELPARVPSVDPALLWRAVVPAIRYWMLFPRLDEKLMPVIGTLPRVALLLNRPAPAAPVPIKPLKTYHSPLLIHDVATVLVEAASEPLRLLVNSGDLYAKDTDRLARALLPTPAWLTPAESQSDRLQFDDAFADPDDPVEPEGPPGLPSLSRGSRIGRALEVCMTCRFLSEEQQKHHRLVATTAARDWLALSPREQLLRFLLPFRDGAATSPTPGAGGSRAKTFLGDSPGQAWIPKRLDLSTSGKKEPRIDWRAAHVDAFSGAANGEFVPVTELLRFHGRENNPLLGRRLKGSYGPTPRISLGYYNVEPDELDLETLWSSHLSNFLMYVLIPLGAVEVGMNEQERSIRLHSLGRYMLGLADDFEWDVQGGGDVVIQPNFDVVFLSPSPAAEAVVARLAQRIGYGVGTLFRFTKASIVNAAVAGISAEQAIKDLQTLSSKPIPGNVRRTLEDWFGRVKVASLSNLWTIEAPDEATAIRIREIAGAAARAITPTLVGIGGTATHAVLVRKLKESGIIVMKTPTKGRSLERED